MLGHNFLEHSTAPSISTNGASKMRSRIPPGFSLYLDAVRFLTSVVVLLHHTWPLIFPKFPPPWPRHSAVVVFFVLSGYVITHASKPELGLNLYAQHRMARILPVTLTAILLTFCISPIVSTTQIPHAGPMEFNWSNALLNAVVHKSEVIFPIGFFQTDKTCLHRHT
jgi:peptidoglycan/LPS O-acetylase OafA/YrhL